MTSQGSRPMGAKDYKKTEAILRIWGSWNHWKLRVALVFKFHVLWYDPLHSAPYRLKSLHTVHWIEWVKLFCSHSKANNVEWHVWWSACVCECSTQEINIQNLMLHESLYSSQRLHGSSIQLDWSMEHTTGLISVGGNTLGYKLKGHQWNKVWTAATMRVIEVTWQLDWISEINLTKTQHLWQCPQPILQTWITFWDPSPITRYPVQLDLLGNVRMTTVKEWDWNQQDTLTWQKLRVTK